MADPKPITVPFLRVIYQSSLPGTPPAGEGVVVADATGILKYKLANGSTVDILNSGTPVTVPQGGTGLTTIASGKLIYASALDTFSALTLGGSLAITTGTLDIVDNTSNQKVRIYNGTTLVGTRRGIAITGATSVTDNPTDDRVDVLFSGGGGGYNLIWEDGVALAARTNINFIGAGITAVDNPGGSRTDVTIHDASVSQTGVVTTSSQVFSGVKTFDNNIIANSMIGVGITPSKPIHISYSGGNQGLYITNPNLISSSAQQSIAQLGFGDTTRVIIGVASDTGNSAPYNAKNYILSEGRSLSLLAGSNSVADCTTAGDFNVINKLGINTSSPGTLLHITTTGTAETAKIRNSSSIVGSGQALIDLGFDDSNRLTLGAAGSGVSLPFAGNNYIRTVNRGLAFITSPTDTLRYRIDHSTGLFQFAGTDNTYPALKRSTIDIEARLADDSQYTYFSSLGVKLQGSTSGLITLRAADTTTSYTLKFPNAAPASNGQSLTGNTDGTTSWTTVSGGSSSLSGLTAATATNDIDNATFAQIWRWNTLASATGLLLSSSSTAAASNNQKLLELALSGANNNSTQTTYTFRSLNTHTGTSSTNVAGYFSASGGTNNYGLIVENGNVGFGTLSPQVVLQSATAGGNSLQYALMLTNPNTVDGGGSATGILFQVETTGNAHGKAGIAFERTGSFGRGALKFLVDNTADSTSAALNDVAFTINANGTSGFSGFVGFGHTAPSFPIDISLIGSALAQRIRNTAATSSSARAILEIGFNDSRRMLIQSNGDNTGFGSAYDASHIIEYQGVPLRINNGGTKVAEFTTGSFATFPRNVGFGTNTSPGTAIDVTVTSAIATRLRSTDSASGGSVVLIDVGFSDSQRLVIGARGTGNSSPFNGHNIDYIGAGFTISNSGTLVQRFTTGSEVVFPTNVGFGTTTDPATNIDITNTAATFPIRLRNSSSQSGSNFRTAIDLGFSDSRRLIIQSNSDTGIGTDYNAAHILEFNGVPLRINSGSTKILEFDTSNNITLRSTSLFRFGGNTTSFPLLKNSGDELQVRLGDDSVFGSLQASKLTLTLGTITSATSSISNTVTWNSAGTAFDNIFSNITDSASLTSSTLLRLQVGGVDKLRTLKSGDLYLDGGNLYLQSHTMYLDATNPTFWVFGRSGNDIALSGQPNSGAKLNLYESAGGSSRLAVRLDINAVGLGTSSPASLLDIVQNSDSTDTTNPVGLNLRSVGAAGELTASSGTQIFAQIFPVINQSSTAGYTVLKINATSTATGSGSKYLIDAHKDSVSQFSVSSTGVVKGDIFDATTGFKVNGAATSGNLLIGDGTNFISKPLVLSQPTAGTNTANTTTETNGLNYTLPANTLTANSKLLVRFIVSLNSTAGDTFTIRLKVGGTEYHGEAIAVSASTANFIVEIKWEIKNLNATNSNISMASKTEHTAQTSGSATFDDLGKYYRSDRITSIDFTASQAIVGSVQMGTASAGNNWTLIDAEVIKLN